ncbi:MAG: hypothetical protein R3D05_08030 [Dongiaceae bacterium]
MYINQVASVAATIEAARVAGIQQAGSAAAAVATQRESNRAAAEADVRDTEAVQETEEKPASSETKGRRVNITV